MENQTPSSGTGDPFGLAISVEEANAQIRALFRVQDELRDWLNDGTPPSGVTINFIRSLVNINVFIFDKNLIERFRDADRLTHYIACLGAKEDGATIVFAGCERVDDSGTDFRVNAVRPGSDPEQPISEHPQTRVLTRIGNPS